MALCAEKRIIRNMLRRVVGVVAAVGAVLCVGLVAVWVRSCYVGDAFFWYRDRASPVGTGLLDVDYVTIGRGATREYLAYPYDPFVGDVLTGWRVPYWLVLVGCILPGVVWWVLSGRVVRWRTGGR